MMVGSSQKRWERERIVPATRPDACWRGAAEIEARLAHSPTAAAMANGPVFDQSKQCIDNDLREFGHMGRRFLTVR
jgi:hypothetical protein